MKTNHLSKRMTGAALSALMLMTAAIPLPQTAVTVFAGQQLGQTDFEEGIGFPWAAVAEAPSKLQFEIDGSYNIMIVNQSGSSYADCQFRHMDLRIAAGHTYHVHAEIESDHDGELYAVISDYSGDWDHEVWHNAYGATEDASYEPVEWIQSGEFLKVTAGEKLVIDARFTAEQDLPQAKFAFMFGGGGVAHPNECFPIGTELKFDHLSLIDETSDDNDWSKGDFLISPVYAFSVNQAGYLPQMEKSATFFSDEPIAEQPFYVIREAGTAADADQESVAYRGTIPASDEIDPASGKYTSEAVFGNLNLDGNYHLSLTETGTDSQSFPIRNDIYDGMMKNAVNYFYQNRSGIPIEEKYITSSGANASKSDLASEYFGHQPDTGYIQMKWVRVYDNDGSDVETKNGTLEANHGWYQAEHYTKDVCEGAYAVWMLQNMYEWTCSKQTSDGFVLLNGVKLPASAAAEKFADKSGAVVVPETDNAIPDILDETKYELDFLQEMIVPKGYVLSDANGETAAPPCQNMLFHAVRDHKLNTLAVRAWDIDYQAEIQGESSALRVVTPPSTRATLSGAAAMAQGARLFAPYDEAYSEQLLTNAKNAFDAALKNQNLYAPSEEYIAGPYYENEENLFYWAACELYISTGDKRYLNILETQTGVTPYVLPEPDLMQSCKSFSDEQPAGCGTLSLALHTDLLSDEAKNNVIVSILSAANTYIKREQKEGFGVPYTSSNYEMPVGMPGALDYRNGYEFGSNGLILNNAIVMMYAGTLANGAEACRKYINGAAGAMDYLFGRNPNTISYVTGCGYAARKPAHRTWVHSIDSAFPYPPAGVLVSGPCSEENDNFMKNAGFSPEKQAPQTWYADTPEAWSVNSCGLNLNASLAWMMNAMEMTADAQVIPEQKQPDEKTETEPPEEKDVQSAKVQWGNVDCSDETADGAKIDVSDAVLLARFTAQDNTVSITSAGQRNANVYISAEDPENLDTQDVITILKVIAKIIPYESLPVREETPV